MSAAGTTWTSTRTDRLLDLWYFHNAIGRQFTVAQFAAANHVTADAVRVMLARARNRGDRRAVYSRRVRIRRSRS